MIRLFLAVLCSFGLAFSPMATTGAIAAAATMPGCTMDGHIPSKPADHSNMACCTAACQMAAPALLPQRTSSVASLSKNNAVHDRGAVKELASFTVSGLDPPPRLPS